jgi:hypothetical protein
MLTFCPSLKNMRASFFALIAVWVAPFASLAQTTELEALALVRTYLERHNAHDLNAVMALYADDAVFTLSMGRGDVSGKAAIRDLEMFDVLAGSFLSPFGLQARRKDGGWVVDIGGVLESSRIFRAAGLPIVLADPVKTGFTLRNGKIAAITQPEIRSACGAIILEAFQALAAHLTETNDPRAMLVLGENERLNLTPETLTLVIKLLNDSPIPSPSPSAQLECALLDDQP